MTHSVGSLSVVIKGRLTKHKKLTAKSSAGVKMCVGDSKEDGGLKFSRSRPQKARKSAGW